MEVDGCDRELELDQACVTFNVRNNYSLYSLTSDCNLCPFTKLTQLVQSNTSFIFNSFKTWNWRFFNGTDLDDVLGTDGTEGLVCELRPDLGQFGVYQVFPEKCELEITKRPSNPYTPLFIICGALVLSLMIIALLKTTVTYYLSKKRSAISEEPPKPLTRRIQSIDSFRGLSIVMMIFVNNGAGGYPELGHATWNGLLVADLIFPCFIWIMGVCIPLSLSSSLSRDVHRVKLVLSILQRSFLLFLIGVSLNTLGTDADLATIRIFGVLQRFGVAYLVVGLVYTLMSRRRDLTFQRGIFQFFTDFILLIPQWIFYITLLVVYFGIIFHLDIPGCPSGYFGPGGLHDNQKFQNCTGGALGLLDKKILTPEHLYQSPAINDVYQSGPFDPEGLIGCLPTIFQTFLGVQAGKILRVYKDWRSRVARWMTLALIYALIGSVLHFNNIIPVNKNLWSISFVLVTTSFALTVFSIFYILIDVIKLWDGSPFRVPGMNALVMYVGHHICYQIFPFHWKYGNMNYHGWRTITAMWDTGLWVVVAYILHYKKIYITL
ncbi:Similar to HGSNAT: Heparan-alpha-glucosaminide N-acetyltransferase (Homo sapiens) [Cotesia congregata]|uniref:Similar to HGSNAT: Heparan-alpha-glucosaminide N-acetyltransferase (Homo sapiens) n=1 Tax=Cotesia congregata TaxID=51543 RepID=A0A8J2EC35_COTCN|nr:Similar to HGSNAT: Heparan-alpha-glucosaminide N-acetyltransferase (Homo sapiens) [Cotesia congregata]